MAAAAATALVRMPVIVSREEFEAFVAVDPAAGVAVMRGLLGQVARRIRSMNEQPATSEQRSNLHNFWTSGTK